MANFHRWYHKDEKDMSPAEKAFSQGEKLLDSHPLFGQLLGHISVDHASQITKRGACLVDEKGIVRIRIACRLTPEQWAYSLAHCLLHAAFGHFDQDNMSLAGSELDQALWNKACDIYIARFLADIRFGEPICPDPALAYKIKLNDERKIYAHLQYIGDDGSGNPYGTNGSAGDMLLKRPVVYDQNSSNRFAAAFSEALNRSVNSAVSTAGGHSWDAESETPVKRAAQWFLTHYPLLGGLAASFKVVEDYGLCQKNQIYIAAVDPVRGEIYCNTTADFSTEEWRFVLAHEYLHAGLMHHQRCAGRDHYLWNVACDFCVNSWLVEMGIGQMPPDGLLYDKSLQGLSAESIYDIIIRKMRKYRKMGTFRGYGKGDIMSHPLPQFGRLREAVSLDEFFKNSLREGLDFHMGSSRGYLPAGLVEEIRSLTTPPIPWEVELAQWFDSRFPPLEKHRSYARPSRRQAATPHIPRPSYTLREEELKSRTFGVVVDTSGSVSARLLGLSLGAIASYAAAKDVGRVRVVFCDAEAYDAGYMTPEDLAGRVKVTGRGGTVLQPAVDLLEAARDFPPKGPILLITDGEIEDRLHVRREHAFLLPKGNRLPFAAKGKVFYFGDR